MQNGSASLVQKLRLYMLVSFGGDGIMCMTTFYQANKIRDEEEDED